MKVQVLNDSGEILWSYDHETLEGFTSTAYLTDGTQQQIVTALEIAHQQAAGELALSKDVDTTASISIDTTEATKKLNELIELFNLQLATSKGVSQAGLELFHDDLFALVDSIILSDIAPATGTGNASKIILEVKIAGDVEGLAAAIRAGKFHLI